MAARKRTWTPQIVRDRIQASMLVKSLQDHAFGRNEMSKTQIQAAGILLKKCLPDLQSTAITGADGGEVRTRTIIEFVDG